MKNLTNEVQQYNTFEALKYYQKAFDMADTYEVRTKLADCYYRRGNNLQTANLLKLVPEDSLSHDAFRQICYSYQNQGDVSSFVWWTSALVARFPMDGEMVAGLTLALARENQAWKGIVYGEKYFNQDSTNILVNRALADAYVEAWKRHLSYNPSSIATYYNIANTYALLLKDNEQAKDYYQQFLGLARKEENPNAQLSEMMQKADAMLKYYEEMKAE